MRGAKMHSSDHLINLFIPAQKNVLSLSSKYTELPPSFIMGNTFFTPLRFF